jgi:hypothetical protein
LAEPRARLFSSSVDGSPNDNTHSAFGNSACGAPEAELSKRAQIFASISSSDESTANFVSTSINASINAVSGRHCD